ncbi:class A beta-lactamase-related serine hydrolase [Guyparkeria hydrothermalis]|uniref:serine hydrolase n=1 Tax=Guyparkeria hydrothermalis TaxID=923 RepID=UPI00202042AF|nr:serine hydrolase [Guyparkeria hydrothermalis]MCL7750387.1 class A beta-lactamase-related serine hydrolase [Guyparkeria hydrothermalis]
MWRRLAMVIVFWSVGPGLGQAALPADAVALRDAADPALQARLEERLEALKLGGSVEAGQLSIALVDVTNPDRPRLAEVNGDAMLYAASLPKIAILLAAFQRIDEGAIALDDETRDLMTRMIRNSSNTAATEMIRRVGRDYINDLLRSPRYRLYDESLNGGLWVGKEYGRGTAYQRDPLHHLSHGATAFQVARFYYLLETGQLVSPQSSREMKRILGDPAISHKFVGGLLGEVPEAQIYRKSGTWRDWHADSAIVEHDGRTYIAVGLAQNPSGGEWLKRLIVELDGLIMDAPIRTAGLDPRLDTAAGQ